MRSSAIVECCLRERGYTVLELLGRGTTGSVHKIRRNADDQLLVVKNIPLIGFTTEQRAEVLNEAQVSAVSLNSSR